MMTTAPDANVHALAIEGTFDDCQALVKGMFNHHAFRDRVRLSGVNSINWARIVAQAVYYFTAAVALGSPHRKVAFTVPTGNFGDVYAGYVASRMGLPVDRLVVATNVNDILVRAFATGDYEIRDVMPTTSPSMDIQVSSNFERLLFDAYGRDAKAVAGADGLAGAIAPLCDLRARAQADARAVHRRPRRRGGERGRRCAPGCARRITAPIRTPRSRSPSRRRKRAIRRCRWWCCRPRIPPSFRKAVAAACGTAPEAARLARRSAVAQGAGQRAAASIRRRSNATWRPPRARRVKEQRHERGSDPPVPPASRW